MQWAWMTGAVLYLAAVLLDILQVIIIPVPLLIAVPLVLLAIGLIVGPSMRDLKRMNLGTKARDR